MTRSGSLVLCATFGTGLIACGSSTSTDPALNLVPLDNDVPGWTVDQAGNKNPGQRAMIATTCGDSSDIHSISNLIDGGSDGFCKTPPNVTPVQTHVPKEFLAQNYLNSSLPPAPPEPVGSVTLWIAQMSSADLATQLYTDMLQWSDHKGAATPWQEPSAPLVGTDSRIEDTGSNGAWWINFHQDVYYIELKLGPSEPAPDYTPSDATKQAAFTFAQWIASKI